MALRMHLFDHLLTPQKGRTRQASSFGRDPDRGGTWFGLRPNSAKGKRVMIEPGETHNMASISGAGIITRIWMTTLLPFNPTALKGLVLRFYWDGEPQPSVECPFGDFFGVPFGHYISYISVPMSITSGAFNCLWPMPFATNARLDVVNEGSTTVDPFFYQIAYNELESPPDTDFRFHAQWHRENPTQPEVPFTILNTSGRGHYVGCHLFMQNRELWLRTPLSHIAFPSGFGLGMMEGWETIYIDDDPTPIVGTGTEDFFGGSFYYYRNGTFAAPFHGCTVRDYLRGRIAAYRFDITAPIPFQKSLRATIDHGFENQVEGDYTRVAYWFQSEPHLPFPPLPGISARTATPPYANAAQVALALGTPILAGLVLAGGYIANRSSKK